MRKAEIKSPIDNIRKIKSLKLTKKLSSKILINLIKLINLVELKSNLVIELLIL